MSFTTVAIAIGVGTAVSAVGGAVQSSKAKKEAKRLEQELKSLEASRQDIIDPSQQIQDLSAQITNPYANLQVATQAAEMQATQSDIALANTLDQLRATGAGAGGATALARAASQSKQEISASIEAQEAANARLRAEGEAQRQARVMAEQQRVQGARMAGQEFMFGARESRELMQLERTAALGQEQRRLQAEGRQQMLSAISQGASSIGIAYAGYAAGGGGKKKK
jgi:MFS superfamily sulfate permease-like transporter